MLGLLLVASQFAAAEPLRPEVAIIIDDLGNRRADGERALALPGPLNFGILPHTPYAKRLAAIAVRRDHEVIIHMPMQPLGASNPGPGALAIHMSRLDVENALARALSAVPQAQGLNNHMGSLATAHESLMRTVMQTLSRLAPAKFFYLDSRTAATSVSERLAHAHQVPHLSRDVFLDNVREASAIRTQLELLVAKAHRTGHAIGIGHPYAETLEVLEDEVPRLVAAKVRLVKLSRLAHRLGHQPQLARQNSLIPSTNE